jgi:hypothetical protein
MIKALESLAETAFANEAEYFIPVSDLVLEDYFIITSLIIIALNVSFIPNSSIDFVGLMPNEPNLLEIKDLTLLVIGENSFECPDDCARLHRELHIVKDRGLVL